MGDLRSFEDLAGSEFGDFDAIIDMQMLEEMGLASIAGAGAILAATFGAQHLAKLDLLAKLAPKPRALVLSGLVATVGLAGSRALYNVNRDAAMGIAGGVTGLALANAIGSFFPTNPLGAPLGELGDDDDDGQVSDYDYATINGLAEAGVENDIRGLSSGIAGLSGAIVDTSVSGYQPYMA